MPKKRMLELSPIKVQSFVTALGEGEKRKVKGGLDTSLAQCPPTEPYCQDSLNCPATFETFCDTCECYTNYTHCNCTGGPGPTDLKTCRPAVCPIID